MASHLNYYVVRDRHAELARRTERVRRTRTAKVGSRLGRFLNPRSEQRQLALTQRGVERVTIAGGCFEVE